jgi:hypothetical protein
MNRVAALLVTAGTIWIAAIVSVPSETQGQLTTVERVAGTPWWPTKPGVGTAQYVGMRS